MKTGASRPKSEKLQPSTSLSTGPTTRCFRAFSAPDCVLAMAEGFGVCAALEHGLQGSLCHPWPNAHQEQKREEARQLLKQSMRQAWSQEALRRGISLARSGKQDQAVRCYNQALEQDSKNAEAWTALGAAHANLGNLSKAVSCFQRALGLVPHHDNASKYLASTNEKIAQQGLSPGTGISPAASAPPHHTSSVSPVPSSRFHLPGLFSAGRGKATQASSHATSNKTGAHADGHGESDNSSTSSSSRSPPPKRPSKRSTPQDPTTSMDLETALQIVASHYKSKSDDERQDSQARKRHNSGKQHKKGKKHSRRREKRRHRC
ncbi:hypothetical protein WJX74_002539 [Apatococcus lobatus]|uniref:Uncharacterized protein n=1 Tax=Apatococcus lobatus TaxID=904363 RepID=A0AAW1S6M2_9CHLO